MLQAATAKLIVQTHRTSTRLQIISRRAMNTNVALVLVSGSYGSMAMVAALRHLCLKRPTSMWVSTLKRAKLESQRKSTSRFETIILGKTRLTRLKSSRMSVLTSTSTISKTVRTYQKVTTPLETSPTPEAGFAVFLQARCQLKRLQPSSR